MNVNEAIAAVKSNQPHDESPLPWRAAPAVHLCNVLSANDEAVATQFWYSDAAHIAAAVNAAPLLVAEVERLQAVVEAARVAVARIGSVHCSDACRSMSPAPGGYGWIGTCHCGAVGSNFARVAARNALGLEVGHG